jgi:hypothetical protein
MVAEAVVAKDRKKANGGAPLVGPLADGGDEDDLEYTQHVKVPLPFKERLERIAQRINKIRRRQGRRKRALGWFVVRNLNEWMDNAEKALEQADPEG